MSSSQESEFSGSLRVDFPDGSNFVLDHTNIHHISPSTRNLLLEATIKVHEEIEAAREKAEQVPGGPTIGVSVQETIKSSERVG